MFERVRWDSRNDLTYTILDVRKVSTSPQTCVRLPFESAPTLAKSYSAGHLEYALMKIG